MRITIIVIFRGDYLLKQYLVKIIIFLFFKKKKLLEKSMHVHFQLKNIAFFFYIFQEAF